MLVMDVLLTALLKKILVVRTQDWATKQNQQQAGYSQR
jgi:hypothetical protein